ncbi:DUF342 domain-containing protein [Salibacterium salarium]|uniref:DUF342 domain-containing protein n=1 Tax=Salibacterium salarium TaxID=284579 RepID=A0A428N471_9BACI|nr:FapA family protein [Salibacterium salarium]RSL33191.1 DUF342 domain-containing protein [Salibacterium salarium]
MEQDIQDFFEVRISEDKLSAHVIAMAAPGEETAWLREDWDSFLKEQGVLFGIIDTNINHVINEPDAVVYPLEVAQGIAPKNGDPAYIRPVNVSKKSQTEPTEQTGSVDLKQVIDIPMVKAGEFTGEKIDATVGVNGKAVDGEELPSKDGLDFVLRAGKNTRIEGNYIYAIEAGQISVQKKTIHVNPLYEINGDLDLKTGNIDFTGNVTIHGNVPSGFEVKSKGDIRVYGTVESAFLEADGSIYISSGVTAQQKGFIKAGQDVHVTYLNEANVYAGANVYVKQAIMHSFCQAGAGVYCHDGRGQVVGGMVSAVTEIHINEAGNTMNTSTSFYIGVPHDYVKRQKDLENRLHEAKEENQKVMKLLKTLEKKEQAGTTLSSKERIMKLRAKTTRETLKNQANDAAEDLQEMLEVSQNVEGGTIVVEKTLHTNVDIHFGKYRRKINVTYTKTTITFKEGEIDVSVK